MSEQPQAPSQLNIKKDNGIRKMMFIFNQKLIEKLQDCWQKIQILSIQKSPQFLQLKSNQFFKRVSRIFTLKCRQSLTLFFTGAKLVQIQRKIKAIENNKIKDRMYEAKVKSLRVLSRQWKQKKSQNIYKNKYFTPKSQQTPKMLKQKVSQDIYLSLRNILRGKYLECFNLIKISEVIRIRNQKALYLVNYLLHKRKYWLTFGLQKLKLNILLNRQSKNRQQISQLDTKLVPVQDSQIQAIKQKQQKLQSVLDNVAKQKQNIEIEVDTEVDQINKAIQTKKAQINQLKQKKLNLSTSLEQIMQKNSSFQFNKEEIYHLIYKNFLINLKLWQQTIQNGEDNQYISKKKVLQWLQVPALDFQLEKICFKNHQEVKVAVEDLNQLIVQYDRLKNQGKQIDLTEILQNHFSYNAISQGSNTYQQVLNNVKFTYKMLLQILKTNSDVMNNMLQIIGTSYQKIKGQNPEIEHN